MKRTDVHCLEQHSHPSALLLIVWVLMVTCAISGASLVFDQVVVVLGGWFGVYGLG